MTQVVQVQVFAPQIDRNRHLVRIDPAVVVDRAIAGLRLQLLVGKRRNDRAGVFRELHAHDRSLDFRELIQQGSDISES